ncbi:hypothetical protein GCM10010990_34610 [Croceicoccus mobilis]|uniref:Uncharacterized protein n=1 Tax=Croceicoccus mobilis TaxID=1703339 RepID=A0A916Z9X6_9SPHN|nr:hypothetical protein GCM10010990_34610 [Croceicoccus mobilis]
MRDISCLVVPKPADAFFEQPVFEREIRDALLQIARFAAQILHLGAGRGPCGIAGKPALAMSPAR